ncbi:MAG: murein biosynthesis integral membrane protein MurJ [Alphaproteobacteria bacterium]
MLSVLKDKIEKFVGKSPLRTLAYSSIVAANASLLAKIIGFLKEVVVAYAFGLSEDLDIYLLAFVIIGFPLSVIINSTQTILISQISATKNHRMQAEVYSFILAISLIFITLALFLFISGIDFTLPFLASGFSPEKITLLKKALFLLIPYYFFNGINLLAYGVMQSQGRFWLNGLLPITTPIVAILIIFFQMDKTVWEVLVWALVIGTALEFVVLNLILIKDKMIALVKLGKVIKKDIYIGILAILPGYVVFSLGQLIERSIAASLSSGTVAALGYGYRLPTAIYGILVTAVGITVLPYFSAMIGAKNFSYCMHSLKKITVILFLSGLALASVLFFLSDFIIFIFYRRGAFDDAASIIVSPIQKAYFMQIPFALIAILGTKALAAMRMNGTISILTIISVAIQAYLSFKLGALLGGQGIAWATTIGSASLALCSISVVYLALKRKLNEKSLFV